MMEVCDDVLNELTTDMIKWGFWDGDGFYIEDEKDESV